MTRTNHAIYGDTVNLKRFQSHRAPFCQGRGFFWGRRCVLWPQVMLSRRKEPIGSESVPGGRNQQNRVTASSLRRIVKGFEAAAVNHKVICLILRWLTVF
jgi:hypothetical protein